LTPLEATDKMTSVSLNPSYSVVVVSHNHAATLPACLAAVIRLDPPPHRVVMVDNASADASAAVAESFAGRLPLMIVREQENTGFTGATNRGLAEIDSEWVLLLNPDCAPAADFVRQLLAGLDHRAEQTRVAAITGKLVRASGAELTPEAVVDAAGMVVTSSGRHFDRGAGRPDNGSYDRPAWVFGGTAAATLYRRSALLDVAYPNGEVMAASFFAYREDAELAWRLQWRGWSCLYVPAAVAAHRRGFRPEQGRKGHAIINAHSVKNRFLLRLHCADLGWHLRCFPWWLLRDLLVVGACLVRERSSLPALLQLWQLRRDALLRRRSVLGRAAVGSRQVSRWFRRREWVEEVAER
jgi:GT2 family glycosyltransferase